MSEENKKVDVANLYGKTEAEIARDEREAAERLWVHIEMNDPVGYNNMVTAQAIKASGGQYKL